MTELIENKEEIGEIINNKIKNRKLIFTRHYHLRLATRGIEHKRVLEIFPQFQRIFAIEEEKLKFGDVGYELFYKISNNITFSIATCPKKEKLEIIHAIEYRRDLIKRLKK